VRTYNSRALAAAFWLALASSAAAQDEEQTALARSLFEEGVHASDRGEWESATDHFRRSLALRGSPVVSFNLAMALTHVGRFVEATEHFRRTLSDPRAPEPLQSAAQAQIDRLRERLGRLTIAVEGPREGVALELDGQALPDALIGTSPADPGRRVLVAIRDGDEVARAEAELAEGGEAALDLRIPELEPEPAPPIPMPAPIAAPRSAPARHTEDAVGWIVLGVAGGVVVIGAIAAITAFFVIDAQHGSPIEGNLGPAVIVFD
jgi:hypothetical protein